MSYSLNNSLIYQRYPFLSGAKEYIKQRGITIDKQVLDAGYERICAFLQSKHNQFDVLKEIISFAGAKILLTISKNRLLIERVAVAESKRAYIYFNDANEDELKIVEQDFGIKTRFAEGKWWIDLISFVKFAPKAQHYRLVYREIKHGWVRIRHRDGMAEQERARILAEAVREKVSSLPNAPKLGKELEQYASELVVKAVNLIPKPKIPSFDKKKAGFPPCIKQLIESLRRHENLAHHGRWILAVYLVRTGFDMEDIVALFSNAPDFNEKITRYQIQHIIKRNYAMPSCQYIQSLGYCVASCGIKNPMFWRGKDGK
jgi:DNA primase large subunit